MLTSLQRVGTKDLRSSMENKGPAWLLSDHLIVVQYLWKFNESPCLLNMFSVQY